MHNFNPLTRKALRNPFLSTMREQYLRIFKISLKTVEKCLHICLKLFPYFFFYVNEAWNGSFLYTADNTHAIYTTSVIFPCAVGFEIPIYGHRNVTILTTVSSMSYFFMLAAGTPACCLIFFFSVGGNLLGQWRYVSLLTVLSPSWWPDTSRYTKYFPNKPSTKYILNFRRSTFRPAFCV